MSVSRCLILAALVAAPAWGAVPVLEALFPAGGQTGSTFTLAASGKLESTDTLWIDCPGVEFTPSGKKREWNVKIAADAPPGLYLVRASNAEGASSPKWFSIGANPELAEAEPNDEVGKAQAVAKLPAVINARLDKGGDVDGYTVQLAAGETLVAAVEAYALGSPVDMLAHVLDADGVRILTASDSRNLDPALVFKAPAAGAYTIQLAGFAHPPQSDVRFTGGATAVYRLHLQKAPVVIAAEPAVASATAETTVKLRGYGLAKDAPAFKLPAAKGARPGDVVSVPVPGALQPLQVVVADKPALVEQEPNDESGKATVISSGDRVGGCISVKDVADRFSFTAKKGDKFNFQALAQSLGSRLDPVLEILNAKNETLVEQDDGGLAADAMLDWTAPAEGAYEVAVRDRFMRGGDEFFYVLQVQPSAPEFQATVADGKPLFVEAGKSITFKVAVKMKRNWKEPLLVRVAPLPPGIEVAEVKVPAKGGDVEVKIDAKPEAAAFSGPIIATVTSEDGTVAKDATYLLRGENLRGTSLLDETSKLWLTVKPKEVKETKPAAAPAAKTAATPAAAK